jgi:hypothetical protein
MTQGSSRKTLERVITPNARFQDIFKEQVTPREGKVMCNLCLRIFRPVHVCKDHLLNSLDWNA